VIDDNEKEQCSEFECVFENLRKNKNVRDKIEFGGDWMMINFNEYLYVHCDEDCIAINDIERHWHPNNCSEILQSLTDIADGNVIFISRVLGSGVILYTKMIEKEKYEKKMGKYLAKKGLRIYSGNRIIKREGNTWEERLFLSMTTEEKRHITLKYMTELNVLLASDSFLERFYDGGCVIVSDFETVVLKMDNPTDKNKTILLDILGEPDISFLDNFYDAWDLDLIEGDEHFDSNLKKIYALLKTILCNKIISVTGLCNGSEFNGIVAFEHIDPDYADPKYSSLVFQVWNGDVDRSIIERMTK
jgi:hypothetical protein